MARTGPLLVENTVAGWSKATLRVFIRAPIFFTLLIAVQYLSSPLIGLFAKPGPTPSTPLTLLDFLLSEFLLAVVQAPVIERAWQLLAGERTSLRRLLAVTAKRAIPMFAIVIGQLVLTALGLIALIIPGIVVILTFILAAPVCVLEGASPMESLRRSAELTSGIRWRLLGANVLLALPSLLVLIPTSFAETKGAPPMRNWELLTNGVFAATGAWLTILSTLVYDIRCPDRRRSRVADVFA